jgi:hypothetical protein
MRAARIREGDFGRARVRLTGDENLALERAEAVMDATDLAGRPSVEVIGAFRVAPVDEDESGEASIVVDVEGDAGLIVALVWSRSGVAAVQPTADRDDIVSFSFEGTTAWTLIRIVECDSEADAATWLGLLGEPSTGGGRPTRAEPRAPEEPGIDESAGALLEDMLPMFPAGPPVFERARGGAGAAPPDAQPRGIPRIAPPPPPPAPRSMPTPAPPDAPKPRGATVSPAPAGPDNGGGGAASVSAHVSGQMPGTTVVGQIAMVEAILSRDRVTPARGMAFAEEPVKVVEDKPVLVSVSARGYRLLPGTRRVRSVRLKQGRARDVVRFALEAVDPGTAEVTLVFRQNDELPLATLRLVSQISTQAGAETPVTTRADIVQPDADLLSMPTLRIDESIAGGDSYLDVAVQIGDLQAEGSKKIVKKSQFVSQTYHKIDCLRKERTAARDAGVLDVATSKRTALEKLRMIGVDLSRRLFTGEVRQFLWDHVDELDHLVIQTTGELDIPWEVIYVSDPTRSVEEEPEVDVDRFLGMRGSTRLVYSTALPKEIVVRRRRARYLCPDYTAPGLGLSFTAEEVELVEGALRASAVGRGTANAMTRLMTTGFDLLHFAGHGVWAAAPPDQRLLLARYRTDQPSAPNTAYSAATLRRDLPDRDDPARRAAAAEVIVKMVFLNACDVGRTDSSVVGLGGFPEAFLRGGVGVLLGCSWAIDDEIGSRFSRHFYEALKTKDIAEAMREARHQSLDDDDLSALAYVAYAHPHARVTVK